MSHLHRMIEDALPITRTVFLAANQFNKLRMKPRTPVSKIALSPSALMVASTSRRAFSTISSILAG